MNPLMNPLAPPDQTGTNHQKTPAPPLLYGVLTADIYAGMTGLQSLQAMLEGALPHPTLARILCFSLAEIEFGRAVLIGDPNGDHLNPHGTVHGGWAASVLDTALGYATHSTLTMGERFTTVDLAIKYLRPIIVGKTGQLRCTGTIINRGRTLVLGEARLVDKAGKLYAHATSTCMVFPPSEGDTA